MRSQRSVTPSTPSTPSPAAIAQALYGLVATLVSREPRDMSLTALSTLSTLERTGSRRVTDLAAVEGVTQPSMTVLVSGLERSGLVERRADSRDKRVALVALTVVGSEYLRTRRRAGADAFGRLIEKLPPCEVDTLSAAIAALAHLHDLDEERRDPTRSKATRSPGGQR